MAKYSDATMNKYQEIKERRIAKKKMLNNFLNADGFTRKLMIASVHKDNESKIAFIADAIKKIYQIDGVGGPLHIVLDDYNVEDHHILYCLDTTIKEYNNVKLSKEENKEFKKLCTTCAEYLLELSYSKRLKILM